MTTQLQLLVNMIAASFGTGILSMPWATAGASLLPTVAIIFVVSFLTVFTVSLLIQAGEDQKKTELGSLLGMLPGRKGWMMPILVNLTLWFTLWLSLVGYLVTIADALQELLPGNRVVIIIVSAAILLPICFLDMSRLTITSTLSLVATTNLLAITAYTFFQETSNQVLPNDLCWLGFGHGLVTMANTTCTSLIVQMCCLQMYAELEERSPEKFAYVTKICFAILFFVYAGFSVLGYLTYGQDVQANILKDLPNGLWGKASRIGFVFVNMAGYPIFLYPMVSSIRNSTSLHHRGINTDRAANTATIFLVVSSMAVSLVMDNLGFINVIIGAIQCAIFVGICPGLVGLCLLGPRSKRLAFRSWMVALIMLCCSLGALGFFYTDNYAHEFPENCRWGPLGFVRIWK